jgi:hypothetical protein
VRDGATSGTALGYLDVALGSVDAKRQRGAQSIGARSRAVFVVLLAIASGCFAPAAATAASAGKLVRYHGYRITVPARWPVYRLASDPHACVRFNRHAVYLGDPGSSQRCPAHAAGRTEAILIEPLSASAARAGAGSGAATLPSAGTVARIALPAHGVVVTATWASDPGIVERALGRRVRAASGSNTNASANGSAHAAAKSPLGRTAVAGATYTGLGFDECETPSAATLKAWTSSPFHAVGVYLGGANEACSQPNLTSSFVSQETAAGWNLIPTYVGLQSPTNGCGCQAITASQAASEGTAAAQDAASTAKGLGFGSGSPIYYDMEAYDVTTKSTAAVRTFLAAWTTKLHALGFLSGVYGSSDSVIADLAAVYGTNFVEPDNLWIASWNNVRSTADPNVPIVDWPNHQRVHQFRGGHNDTYGRVTLDIDSDYVDGSVAGPGSPPVTAGPAPVLTVTPASNGAIELHASWAGESGITGWQVLAGNSATALTPFGRASGGGESRVITANSQFSYFEVEAISSGTELGSSLAVPTPPHFAIFGRSAFVPAHGLAGVPVGCYVPTGCDVVTTISAGRTVIAQTGADPIAANSGGTVFFKLSSTGRGLLASAASRRLPVTVTATDNSQPTGGVGSEPRTTSGSAPATTATLNLVPYTTSGTSPQRVLTDAPSLRIVAATAFVYRESVGGLLTDCLSATPCRASAKLWHGHTTLAQTNGEQLGAEELGYLSFRLTPAGRRMLQTARGNQLSAHVSETDGPASAGGQIVLVSYD